MDKRYDAAVMEPKLDRFWDESGVYRYREDGEAPIYAIDTPPPTVSGFLHLGHVYSYSHPDFVARFWRMNGYNVYYPMGFDDNGLPTERLVEKQTGKTAEDVGRAAFIATCLEMSREYEAEYERLWRRLGLSIDWRYTYRTIDDHSRATSQGTFLALLRKGLAYRQQAPTIWCPTCHTAIAQAEEKDLDRRSEFVDLAFTLEDGSTLSIATTRPELLCACVAVFVHPDDERYRDIVGGEATVPIYGHRVPILRDPHADPEKGTGAVMCCTFGDQVDVEWWTTHELPLREAIDRRGRMTAIAGQFMGVPVSDAREGVKFELDRAGLLLGRRPTEQSVRVHERCDTPVEYIMTQQWFIRVLEHRETFLQLGEFCQWLPDHMKARYREWVEGLRWDWCVSRQRYYGVPIPLWYCDGCGEAILPEEQQLPVDPTAEAPLTSCSCGSSSFTPEADVFDTWVTSSCSPQIAGRMLTDPKLYDRVFPMTVRPQAHDIIRTWAFYTIVMSHYRFDTLPWKAVLMSGWGLAASGAEKISKSRGGGPMAPMEMVERYSADACRYWAASTGLGRDAVISEEKIAAGAKLVTKLWNVARFAERFIGGYTLPADPPDGLTPADRWILSSARTVIASATESFRAYEYAAAKNAVEQFFWTELCDNYLEMAKKRLYDESHPGHEAARYTLAHCLRSVTLLFAPLLPYVTEAIYEELFRTEGAMSVHRAAWPSDTFPWKGRPRGDADVAGEALVTIASAVRRYKSEHGMSLGAELAQLYVWTRESLLDETLAGAEDDIASVTRAREVTIDDVPGPEDMEVIFEGRSEGKLVVSVLRE